jgi:hypothetical protein
MSPQYLALRMSRTRERPPTPGIRRGAVPALLAALTLTLCLACTDWYMVRAPMERIERETFTGISGGAKIACGLKEDGEAVCWTMAVGNPLGGKVSNHGKDLRSISTGGTHLCLPLGPAGCPGGLSRSPLGWRRSE